MVVKGRIQLKTGNKTITDTYKQALFFIVTCSKFARIDIGICLRFLSLGLLSALIALLANNMNSYICSYIKEM